MNIACVAGSPCWGLLSTVRAAHLQVLRAPPQPLVGLRSALWPLSRTGPRPARSPAQGLAAI
eukprot:11163557-Lingulodinium_polyedra.AAC.1